MTIKTVVAPDNKAPKFKMGKPSKLRQLLTSKVFWIGVIILSALFLFTGGSFFSLLSMYVLSVSVIAISMTVGSYFKIFRTLKNYSQVPSYYQENHDYFKQHLIQDHGFQVDYESIGILVDARSQRIAFTIDPEVRPQITVCDFSDVQRWQSYSQSLETQNQYGVIQNSISKEYVSVYVRNPKQPRYDFFTADSVDADQWVARLDALLN